MVAYQNLKTKEKSSWVILKVVVVAYESFSLLIIKSQFKCGFTKVVLTRAGCLRETSVYKESFDCINNNNNNNNNNYNNYLN